MLFSFLPAFLALAAPLICAASVSFQHPPQAENRAVETAKAAPAQRALQNIPAQVGILGEVGDPAPDVIPIDFDDVIWSVRGAERDVVKYALHHGLQASCPDVLDRRIDRDRHVRNGVDGVVGEFEGHALGRDQRHILLDQRGFWLGEDALQVIARQRLQFDADRQTALQFRQ
jgi:hypothetical protein